MNDAVIGVVGTLLGTILGWVLNSLSDRGKLKVFVSEWKPSHLERPFDSIIKQSSDFLEMKEKTDKFYYDISLDLYNSSNSVKIMRDITINFYKGKNIVMKHTPFDRELTKNYSSGSINNCVLPINIQPKTIVRHKLFFIFYKEDVKNIWDCNYVELYYINENERKKKVRIAKLDFEQDFIKMK